MTQSAALRSSRAAHQVRDAPLAGPTRTEILRAGNDVDSAWFYKDIDAIRGRFPGDADVAHASRHADALHNTRLGAFVGASVADYGDAGHPSGGSHCRSHIYDVRHAQ